MATVVLIVASTGRLLVVRGRERVLNGVSVRIGVECVSGKKVCLCAVGRGRRKETGGEGVVGCEGVGGRESEKGGRR